jgi:hypothetical protein
VSWLNLALGLIREAATSDVGQDILRDIRKGRAGERPAPATDPGQSQAKAVEAWMKSVEDRLEVLDRNVETLVGLVNAQDEALIRIQKRQRIWNLALAGGLLAAAAVLVWLALA